VKVDPMTMLKFRFDGKTFATSCPRGGLGVQLVEDLKDLRVWLEDLAWEERFRRFVNGSLCFIRRDWKELLKEEVRDIQFKDPKTKPSGFDKEYFQERGFADLTVRGGDLDDWHVLLWNSLGRLRYVVTEQVALLAEDYDPDWFTYTVDLDNYTLEVESRPDGLRAVFPLDSVTVEGVLKLEGEGNDD